MRAFDAMIDRIIMRNVMRRHPAPAPAVPAPAQPAISKVVKDNASLPWILPLLRIVRQGRLSIAGVVEELPRHLPAGAPCPTYQEVEAELLKLGMVAGD
jgi:hypothetical protein